MKTATNNSKPIFWRDARLPHVELRKVADGREVCYAPHTHAQWSMGAITGGESTFEYRSDHYRVQAGDLVLMNPEWVHTCNPIDNQPWAYLMLYVDTAWLTDLRFRAGLLPERRWRDISTAVISDPIWFERYCNLAECLLEPEYELLEKQSQVVEFLSDLMHELASRPVAAAPKAPEILTDLARFLDDHAADDVSLDTLCELSGFSPGHLIRGFKQHFGLTPHAYLVNRRVQLGRQQLRSGTAIAEAALNAGFADQPHFQRAFKRLMAATPNQYRRASADHKVQATGRQQ
ncbi:MAG: AraC family transcriptional regulator [Marinobacter sp.]|nr:AraC family transcriptional regulator [Marinobacter sp.]